MLFGKRKHRWWRRKPRVEPLVPRPEFGTVDGHPVEYIGPAQFPDCRRETCMNTAPHAPGRECIG